MSVRDLSEAIEDLSLAQADICVVGAGMAGLFIARKLALAGRKVVIVESGKAGFDQQTHDLNEIVDIHGHYTRALNGRYRGLGGSSTQWGGRMIPIREHDAQARPHLHLDAWPFPFGELEAYAHEVEAVFGLPHDSYDKGPLEQTRLSDTFPIEDPDFFCRWPKWINFRQCNLASVWRRELEAFPNLDIWLGATVTDFQLDTEQGRLKTVKAVNFNGKSLSVQAERFVIAAGTIETTRLLLWLDAQSNNHAFAGCQVLGRYFQDHLKAEVATISRADQKLSNRLFGYHFIDATRRSLHLELTPAAQKKDGVSSAFAYVAMDLSESRLERIKRVARGLQNHQTGLGDVIGLVADMGLVARMAYWRYARQQVFMPPDVGLHVQIAIEQAPQWDNRIALASERDRLGLPKAELHWKPTTADEDTFRSITDRLKHYWLRSGLQDKCPMVWTSDHRAPIVDSAEAYAHPSGTTRMGTDAATSVVGPDLNCHAIANVSIASASAFPTAGSANPTLTILELTLRLADTLSGRKGPQAARQERTAPQADSASLVEAMAAPMASATRATSSSPI